MRNFLAGRAQKADIVISDADHSVSDIHLEITEDAKGYYYIIDCNSTNGTFRKRGGRWEPVKETSYVGLDDLLLLGKYQTSIRKLLAMRVNRSSLQRDPETGEIIPKH
ncbi:MAG: FHA domain-containing protein [Pseudomonadota bacterium]